MVDWKGGMALAIEGEVWMLGGSREEPYSRCLLREWEEVGGLELAASSLRELLVGWEGMMSQWVVFSWRVEINEGRYLAVVCQAEEDVWQSKVRWCAPGDRVEDEYTLQEVLNMLLDWMIQSKDWIIHLNGTPWRLSY
jgi:hypothetical protein